MAGRDGAGTVKEDQPRRTRVLKLEAGVTVGGRQPVKKARWYVEVVEDMSDKIGLHDRPSALRDGPVAQGGRYVRDDGTEEKTEVKPTLEDGSGSGVPPTVTGDGGSMAGVAARGTPSTLPAFLGFGVPGTAAAGADGGVAPEPEHGAVWAIL